MTAGSTLISNVEINDSCHRWILQGHYSNDKRWMHVSQGWLKSVIFCYSYFFVSYYIFHDKLSIFTAVVKTVLVHMVQHITNPRSFSPSVGDEHGIPAWGHLELIDFAFIVWIPGKSSILKWWSNKRFIGLFSYRRWTDVKVSTYNVRSQAFYWLSFRRYLHGVFPTLNLIWSLDHYIWLLLMTEYGECCYIWSDLIMLKVKLNYSFNDCFDILLRYVTIQL
jgi:hypothetical protein